MSLHAHNSSEVDFARFQVVLNPVQQQLYEELKGKNSTSLNQQMKRSKIPTSGITRRTQMIAALVVFYDVEPGAKIKMFEWIKNLGAIDKQPPQRRRKRKKMEQFTRSSSQPSSDSSGETRQWSVPENRPVPGKLYQNSPELDVQYGAFQDTASDLNAISQDGQVAWSQLGFITPQNNLSVGENYMGSNQNNSYQPWATILNSTYPYIPDPNDMGLGFVWNSPTDIFPSTVQLPGTNNTKALGQHPNANYQQIFDQQPQLEMVATPWGF